MRMRTIECRLRKLEARLIREPPIWPMMTMVMGSLPAETILQPGERIVHDLYRDFNGIAWARERVTADPQDQGQSCGPGGVLLPVLEEIHRSCDYHLRGDSCRACDGTPVCPKTIRSPEGHDK